MKYNKVPLLEIWRRCCIKIQKTSHDDTKGKSAFQTIAIELYKQQKEKEHLRIVINSVGVCVVPKTNDEVYVSNTTKMCIYFSFVLSDMPKKFHLLKISKVM